MVISRRIYLLTGHIPFLDNGLLVYPVSLTKHNVVQRLHNIFNYIPIRSFVVCIFYTLYLVPFRVLGHDDA